MTHGDKHFRYLWNVSLGSAGAMSLWLRKYRYAPDQYSVYYSCHWMENFLIMIQLWNYSLHIQEEHRGETIMGHYGDLKVIHLPASGFHRLHAVSYKRHLEISMMFTLLYRSALCVSVWWFTEIKQSVFNGILESTISPFLFSFIFLH